MKPLQLFAVVLFAGASFTGKVQDDQIVTMHSTIW